MNFHTPLLQWYKINKRELPWRDSKDPYLIWISEIIMQQTRIEQGLPYYMRFTESFKTVHELANAPIDQVLKLWQGLGYYSRARNLHEAAKIISSQFNGQFPISMKELKRLPGVGDYTAAAIASICNDEKVPAIDGNLNRVISRFYDINEPVDKANGKKLIYTLGEEAMLKVNKPGDLNQALMDFGATICTPKTPKCNTCLLNEYCLALKNDSVLQRPIKSLKTKSRQRFFIYLHILYMGKTFIKKREAKDIWQGLYEFPLIEQNTELNIEKVLDSDEFKNIIGSKQNVKMEVFPMKPHILSHQKIISAFIKIELSKEPNLNQYLSIPIAQINDFAFPKLIEQYLDKT